MNHLTDENYIMTAMNQYSDTVFRVAFQYTKNRADTEDVLQEVFLALCKKVPLPSLDDDRLKAWLIRVTINKSKDYLRANKRRRAMLNNYIPPEPPCRYDEVFEALEKLPERDRNALYLHYYEGYTAREIAGILGGSERAITKR
ncbi:MAG: sigma-70 family RNA polymerase sigma factor, partial [Clostridia bacterium]|nr:sigma-70 family RNA polymerase sigma factor [Clostridia bacterium]